MTLHYCIAKIALNYHLLQSRFPIKFKHLFNLQKWGRRNCHSPDTPHPLNTRHERYNALSTLRNHPLSRREPQGRQELGHPGESHTGPRRGAAAGGAGKTPHEVRRRGGETSARVGVQTTETYVNGP